MTNDKQTLKALHDLVATCNDAAEGYAKAAKGVHDSDLSDWLAQASADREHFAADLKSFIKKLGDEPGLDLHEGGILHKGWVDLEQRLRSREPELHSKDDDEIIRECIAGDSGSLRHYDHALAQELTPELRSLILEQRTAVTDNLVYLQNRVSRNSPPASFRWRPE
jgi:uncharacterized protein (TIGR02284 family)